MSTYPRPSHPPAWPAFSHPPQVTQNGLALVLDLAAGAFVKPGPLIDIAAD